MRCATAARRSCPLPWPGGKPNDQLDGPAGIVVCPRRGRRASAAAAQASRRRSPCFVIIGVSRVMWDEWTLRPARAVVKTGRGPGAAQGHDDLKVRLRRLAAQVLSLTTWVHSADCSEELSVAAGLPVSIGSACPRAAASRLVLQQRVELAVQPFDDGRRVSSPAPIGRTRCAGDRRHTQLLPASDVRSAASRCVPVEARNAQLADCRCGQRVGRAGRRGCRSASEDTLQAQGPSWPYGIWLSTMPASMLNHCATSMHTYPRRVRQLSPRRDGPWHTRSAP